MLKSTLNRTSLEDSADIPSRVLLLEEQVRKLNADLRHLQVRQNPDIRSDVSLVASQTTPLHTIGADDRFLVENFALSPRSTLASRPAHFETGAGQSLHQPVSVGATEIGASAGRNSSIVGFLPQPSTDAGLADQHPGDLGSITPMGRMVEQMEITRHAVTEALLDVERDHWPKRKRHGREGFARSDSYRDRPLLPLGRGEIGLTHDTCEDVFAL